MAAENSVSYTHLDVYKRQVQTEIITETIKKMCREANYSLSSDMVKAMRKAEEKEESVPVSYTHLDVYKRQA